MSGLADKGEGGEDPNLKHAREAQKYFDNYAPILIFGILGLALQSVVWRHNIADFLNIAAFFLILAAGIVSLWRLERLPKFYVNAAEVNSATETRNRLVGLLSKRGSEGEDELKEWLVSTGQQLGHFGAIEQAEQDWSKRWYAVQKWCFVVGLFLLLAARIFPAFLDCGTK